MGFGNCVGHVKITFPFFSHRLTRRVKKRFTSIKYLFILEYLRLLFLRQDLTMNIVVTLYWVRYSGWSLSSQQSSCLSPLIAKFTGMFHHTWHRNPKYDIISPCKCTVIFKWKYDKFQISKMQQKLRSRLGAHKGML